MILMICALYCTLLGSSNHGERVGEALNLYWSTSEIHITFASKRKEKRPLRRLKLIAKDPKIMCNFLGCVLLPQGRCCGGDF
jgi:hypothetical protein